MKGQSLNFHSFLPPPQRWSLSPLFPDYFWNSNSACLSFLLCNKLPQVLAALNIHSWSGSSVGQSPGMGQLAFLLVFWRGHIRGFTQAVLSSGVQGPLPSSHDRDWSLFFVVVGLRYWVPVGCHREARLSHPCSLPHSLSSIFKDSITKISPTSNPSPASNLSDLPIWPVDPDKQAQVIGSGLPDNLPILRSTDLGLNHICKMPLQKHLL